MKELQNSNQGGSKGEDFHETLLDWDRVKQEFALQRKPFIRKKTQDDEWNSKNLQLDKIAQYPTTMHVPYVVACLDRHGSDEVWDQQGSCPT